MNQENKRNGFIMQGSILAIAGILVRIIGILYRKPLTSIIGDEGNGYYSMAYNIYTIILLLASYSIPSAVSKVIAQRLALREYKNAHRIFQCALIYVVIVGGVASLFTFVFAGVLVDANTVSVLRVFVPTIFFSGLLGVLRGYFQAHQTMIQTSLSQILEQIINAVVSVFAAWLLIQTAAAGADSTTKAIRGATGSAMGTGAGVLIALLFMYGMYMMNRKQILRKVNGDQEAHVLSTGEGLKLIVMMVTPFILSTFIYNLSTALNQTIYVRIMLLVKHYTSSEAATMYGIYSGKAVVIVNIPIAIASAMSAAMIPSISGTFATKDVQGTRDEVAAAVQTTMLIAIPAAVGLAVLAKPITALLFPQPESLDTAASLLRASSITVVFYSLSTLTNAVLQGIGQVNRPVIHAAIALVVQTVVLVPLLLFTDWNQYCIVIAAIVYSFTMCLLNQWSVRKSLAYRQEYMSTFLLPILSAVVMGAVAWGSYEACYSLCKSSVISVAIAIVLAVLVYFVMILRTGAVSEDELQKIPRGGTLLRLARKLHLM